MKSTDNPFLDPILARWRAAPEQPFGMFFNGDDWVEISNAAFFRRVLQFRALLAAAAVGSGDIVLIILEHGVDAHAAFIGAMLLGAIPGFMPYPNVKQEAARYWRQHRDVFVHAGPRAVLVYDALVQPVTEAAAGTGAVILSATDVNAMSPLEPDALPPATATALLQHSSGTTGLKKGVKLTYRAITEQLVAYRQALHLTPGTEFRVASWLPLYHDMGLISSFLLPVWHGAPILSIDPFEWTRDPLLLLEAIQEFGGTHAWVPNFSLLHQVRSARGGRRYCLESLQALICCSEPNKAEAFDLFYERFADWGIKPATLQTCYAMAETVFAASQSPIGVALRRLAVDRDALQTQGIAREPQAGREHILLLSNGPPIPGCEIRIRKDDVYVGECMVGEICISAPYLFTGYHNNPAATDTAFVDSYLLTGDLGFLERGEVFIVGRIKDIIIVNGKNIVAHDVEAAISRISEVKPGRAVAFGHYAEKSGSEHLVVVAERAGPVADEAATIRAISNAVSEEVGVGCSDVRLVAPGWLIKTTSGKISRSENLVKYRKNFIEIPDAK